MRAVLDTFLNYSWIAYTGMKYLYFCIGVLMALMTPLAGYYLQKRIVMFGIYFPFIDPLTSPGFEINYIFMIYLLYLTIHGLTGSDSYFVVFTILSMGQLRLISEMQLELNALLRSNTLAGKDHDLQIESQIKKIVSEHQEHLKLAVLFETVFSLHSLVIVGSASLTIVVCMVVLMDQLWFPGITMIAVSVWQIFFTCRLGTAFESSCKEFEKMTCMIDWYLLAPKHRRHWLSILTMATMPQLHTMGGVRPSNLNSFVLVRSLHDCM